MITSQVEVVQVNDEKKLESKLSFEHRYPPTKIMWAPDPEGSNTQDLMVTSGELLRVWSIENNERAV